MKKLTILLMTVILIFALSACSGNTVQSVTSIAQAQADNTTAGEAVPTSSRVTTVAEALAENSALHEDADDYVWDNSAVIPISLNENSITVNDERVSVDGSQATITSAGTYSLSGSLSNGQIIVNTEDEEPVRLILNGVQIHNSAGAAINVISAEESVIVLADGTENIIADGESYTFDDPETDEPDAAIFSKSDLTIYGNGSLTVNGNYNDGIASKDGLIITSGSLTVTSVDDGIRGKDYLVIEGGNISIDAGGDGLKSDNEEDATKGFISIEAGVLKISASGDAITAQTDVMITSGDIMLSSGGGSSSQIDENTSAKGIKAVVNVNIDGGIFTINAADDAIHSNDSIVINGGTFSLASADDGMHADSTLEVNGGDIQITDSYEGIESAVITINAGNIHLVSSDDGINVAGGMDGSGMLMGPGGGGRPGRGSSQDVFSYSGDYYLYINGGYIVIEAAGDGIDVNGAIEMTDGVVLVSGPTEQMNGALDYDAYFNISGGFFVAVGSAGMAQAPSTSSSQYSVALNLNSTVQAGTLVHVQSSSGDEILTFSPSKAYQSIVFSSPELVNGTTYDIYFGGSSTGSEVDGLYQDGSYSPGSQYTSLTITSMVTGSGMGGGRRRP